MKKMIVKRLVYHNMVNNEIFYGAEQYDGQLTNENILGAVYTLGKHGWCPYRLGLYQYNTNGELVYQITIEEFEQYQKSWYNLFWDWVRRIV